MPPSLTLIVAHSRNQVIGRDGGMPWHIKADLQYFKAQTLGHRVVMGRRTFASLGKPLPGRENVVVTHSVAALPGCVVTDSLDDALSFERLPPGASVSHLDTIFVAGGGNIYRQLLDKAPPNLTRLLVTEVDIEVEGDTFFPNLNPHQWREIKREPGRDGALSYHFVTYQRQPQ